MGKVFVLDSNNNYHESMTKEEILAAIQTAAAGGSFEGFENCSFVSFLKEKNRGAEFSVWVGTQAEYNAIARPESNVLYLISDDPLCTDIPNRLDEQAAKHEEQDELLDKHTKSITNINLTLEDHSDEIVAVKNSIDKEKPVVIYNNASGNNTYFDATEALANFREVVFVYSLVLTSTGGAVKHQKRFFTADNSSKVVLDAMANVNYNEENYPMQAASEFAISGKRVSKNWFYASLGTISTTSMYAIKINKIYGIGRVKG